MPIADLVGRYAATEFLSQLRNEPRLMAVTRATDVPPGNDRRREPVPGGTITIRDYTPGTDLGAAERPDPSYVDVVVDQRKYFNVYVDDTEEYETPVSLGQDAGRRGAEGMSDTINSHLFASLINSIPNGVQDDAGTLAITGGWDATKRAKIIETMGVTALAARKAGFPADRTVWLTSFEMEDQLGKYLSVDNKSFGTGGMSDRAFASATLPTIFGYPVVVDKAVTYKNTAGAYNPIFLIVEGRTLAYAQTLAEARAVRPTNRFGTEFQALMNYGAKRLGDTHIRAVKMTVS